MKKMFYGNPHKSHSALLDHGIDAITFKLFLSSKSEIKSNALSELVKHLT